LDNKNRQRRFISAVIPAAGQGTRMGTSLNKQYLTLAGKPILAYTIDVFERCPLVNEIVVVINPNEQEIFKRQILNRGHYKKVNIAFGGRSRQESVYRGLQKVNTQCQMVLIHDGARPLIDGDLILRCIYETIKHHATIVAVPAKNTIKVVNSQLGVEYTPNRKLLYEVQTPQTFDFDLIMKAHEQAIEEHAEVTDDAALVERMGEKVTVVKGHYNNIKITTPEDLMIANSIITVKQ
jgi:2-C-methyl-D-erythritol 4-phosphate cytidylyltransferase